MEKLNILYCLDDFDWNYSRHLAVSLLSLLETNNGNLLHIYILSSFLSDENKKEIERIVLKYNQSVSFFISQKIIPNNIKKIIINARKELTLATFYRLFFKYNIPDVHGRILYIDCDTLINVDLANIYNIEMEWNIVVWGEDVGWMRYWKKKTLWINNYINAGVLLIDIDKFNAIDFKKEINAANMKYYTNIQSDDQDYLNIILQWKIKIHDYRINCIINRQFFLNFKDVYIIHLTNKPFIKFSRVPQSLKQKYNTYLQQTKWKNFTLLEKVTIQKVAIYIYDNIRDILIYIWWKFLWWLWEYYMVQVMALPIFIYKKIKKIWG